MADKVEKILQRHDLAHLDWMDMKMTMKNIDGYIQKEAKAIEIEMTAAVHNHLVTQFKGFKLCKPNGFPVILRDPKTDSILTDLDGVFILTNDYEELAFVDPLEIQPSISDKEVITTLKGFERVTRDMSKVIGKQGDLSPANYKLVIIEAKHHVTVDKIKYKLEQMEKIKQYLDHAKNIDSDTTLTKKFKKNVAMFNFHLFDPNPMLYIGGIVWDDEALKEYKRNITGNASLGIVKLNGKRFNVTDSLTSNIDSYMAGGKKPRKKKNTI